jgi:release factor glutamine methyltransferase
MTVGSFLTNKGTTIDIRELEILLEWVLRCDRGYIIAHPEHTITNWQAVRLYYAIFLYNHGWSIAHITRHKEFFGLDFYVNRHTLIPRPDTETLVEQVLSILETTAQDSKVTIIDVGTGSGCIPITIGKKSLRPLTLLATDISRGALKVAQKNAAQHAVQITFFRGNVLEPLISVVQKIPQNEPIIITANLPYLTHEQFESEPSIQKEPYTALVAEEGGLALYRTLLTQIKKALMAKRSLTLCIEIDPSQEITAPQLITSFFPLSQPWISYDLSGRARVVSASLVSES